MILATPDPCSLQVGKATLQLPYPAKEVVGLGERFLVLLDPDAYLVDPKYQVKRRRGEHALRNLLAFSAAGELLWAAEYPEEVDYYYRITSEQPLKALSFSSYECVIDPTSGRILSRVFFK